MDSSPTARNSLSPILPVLLALASPVVCGCTQAKSSPSVHPGANGPVGPAWAPPPAGAPAPSWGPPASAVGAPPGGPAPAAPPPPGTGAPAGQGRPPAARAQSLDGTCWGSMECGDEQAGTLGGWSFNVSFARSTVVGVHLSNSCAPGTTWTADARSLAVPVVRDGTTVIPLACTVMGAAPEQRDCSLQFRLYGGQIMLQHPPGSQSGGEVTGTCSWVVR